MAFSKALFSVLLLVLPSLTFPLERPTNLLVERGGSPDPTLNDYVNQVRDGGEYCLNMITDKYANKDHDYKRDISDVDERDNPRNMVPEFVRCSTPQGSNSQIFTRDQITLAIAQGMLLMGYDQLATAGRRSYPHGYDTDADTPNLGHAARNGLFEYPLFPSMYPFGSNMGSSSPGEDRVVFDNCGQFATVLTHRGLDGNRLRACHEVDRDGNPINTPGVSGSNPNPPPLNPPRLGGAPIAGGLLPPFNGLGSFPPRQRRNI